MAQRATMAHENDGRGPNPLFQPASRIEVYVLIIVALGTKTLPLLAPGAVAWILAALP